MLIKFFKIIAVVAIIALISWKTNLYNPSLNTSQDMFVGTLTTSLKTNEISVSDFDKEVLIKDRYFFEENILSRTRSYIVPGSDSKSRKDTTFEVLMGYYITDTKKGRVYEFDSSSNNPKVIESYPISGSRAKKTGYDFTGESCYFNIQYGSFIHVADTIVDGVKHLIFADTVIKSNNIDIIKKIVAYVNPSLKKFPIVLERNLNKRLNGWVYRLDFYIEDPKGGSAGVLSNVYSFNPVISPEKLAKMNRYIALAQKYQKKASKN